MLKAETRLTSPRAVGLLLAGWTAFGVLSAIQIHVRDASAGRADSWRSDFNIVYFYWAWAIVTPFVVSTADRIAARSRPGVRGVAWLVAFAAPIVGVQSFLYALFQLFDGRTESVADATRLAIIRHAAGNVLTYAVVVLLWIGWRYYLHSQQQLLAAAESARRASDLERTLTRVRLDALMAQLRPHFLFNTLNVVSALITRHDAVTANRAIARLGDLLRATLSAQDEREIPLSRELDYTRHFLEIAQLRFGSRLSVEERIDGDVGHCMVPPFILQPIVENSILHATSVRDDASRIEVSARRQSDSLELEVRDDGPGFSAIIDEKDQGAGLSIVRQRLEQMYGSHARLRTTNAPNGGAIVTITLPRTQP